MPQRIFPLELGRNRRSIRLKGYDYNEAGAYFVTICTQDHKCILHDPVLRAMIENIWHSLPTRFPSVSLDEFVIMPNHIHFIIYIGMPDVGAPLAGARVDDPIADVRNVGAPLAGARVDDPIADVRNVGAPLANARIEDDQSRAGASPAPTKRPAPTLGDIVGAFKSLVATHYLQWVKTHDPSRRANLWQRNYYEHIIRNEREWDAIQRYIITNPDNWNWDPYNPQNAGRPEQNTRDYLDDILTMTG